MGDPPAGGDAAPGAVTEGEVFGAVPLVGFVPVVCGVQAESARAATATVTTASDGLRQENATRFMSRPK